MANKTIGQLDTVSSVSVVGSYVELEVGGVSKKAYFMESGTFTPTVYGVTSAGSGTYTTQEGFYTLCGNIVFYSIRLIWTAHTGSGDMRITGFPFVSANYSSGIRYSSAIVAGNITVTAANYQVFYILPNTIIGVINQVPTGGGAVAVTPLDTAGDLIISGYYPIA